MSYRIDTRAFLHHPLICRRGGDGFMSYRLDTKAFLYHPLI